MMQGPVSQWLNEAVSPRRDSDRCDPHALSYHICVESPQNLTTRIGDKDVRVVILAGAV